MRMIRSVLILLMLWPLALRAELPGPTSIYVSDFAGVLSSEDIAGLTTDLQALRNDPGVEVTIATLQRKEDLGPWSDLSALAKSLFNQWGVGHATRNDGVLILLAVEDREVRVALGSGYPPVWDGRAHRVIEVFMLPRFAEGDYAGGLKAGLHGLEEYLIRPYSEGVSYEDSRDPPRVWGGTAWLDLLVFLGFITLAGSLMLWEGRHRLGDLLARRRPCPQCGRQGVILETSSGGSAGPDLVRRVCRNCGWHQDRRIEEAPGNLHGDDNRRDDNSSGGPDGFGGGQSSGGGAGGRW